MRCCYGLRLRLPVPNPTLLLPLLMLLLLCQGLGWVRLCSRLHLLLQKWLKLLT
jgi:hypothetical protein